ncbi:hypothetical protein Trydic_g9854 [Trypoxylus dichotomus]
MGNRCDHPYEQLQAFQNRILRMTLNALLFARNTTLHEDAGVEPLIDFIRRIATRFFDRAADHWNPLVSASQDYDLRITCRHHLPLSLVVDHQD